jgi:hypothetical protein
MKTPTVLIAAVLCVCYCTGQSNVVYYGTHSNAISLAFADTNLSTSAQEAITSDLRICLSEWGRATQFRLGADDPAFVAHLYNPKITPYYPETLDFPDNVVSSDLCGYALHIPKKLSDAYTNAFAFAAANSNIVAAAYEFVAFVSSSNFVAISSNDLPNYVLQKNTTTNEIIADAQETISELRCQTYYPPSILGFQYSTEGPAATNLWMFVPCSIPLRYMDGKGWHAFSAIWHDGKWKFCVWRD